MEIKETAIDNKDFQELVILLDKELWERYPETQSGFISINKKLENSFAVIGYDDGKPIACGCIKKYEDKAEVKRMYVRDGYRGKGYSKKILRRLEDIAKREGFVKMILETQLRQPEAIGLYKKYGFQESDKYGPYIDSVLSVCMEKVVNISV